MISGVSGEGVRDLLFAALETIQGNTPTAEDDASPSAYNPWDNA